jgi:hypothetical protein
MQAMKKTERASSAFPTTFPTIIQSDGFYLPYAKFGAGGPRDTIELLGRFRTRAAAERALRRVSMFVANAAVAVGGLV